MRKHPVGTSLRKAKFESPEQGHWLELVREANRNHTCVPGTLDMTTAIR